MERGSPVRRVLEELAANDPVPEAATSQAPKPARRDGPIVRQHAIGGVYADGHPWSGNLARVEGGALRYRIVTANAGLRTVPEFVRNIERRTGERARIAWNGGFILNAELVGKLGLSESYIGSPLGLIATDGRVLCPPLYAKPAFLVHESGALEIRHVTCADGIEIAAPGGEELKLEAAAHNPRALPHGPCYYDLLYPGDELPGDGRVLVRLAGNRIMQVVETSPGSALPVLPVGLVLSFPAGELPAGFEEGAVLELRLPGLAGVAQAIEAGPLLVDRGRVCIDADVMRAEGWSTRNSIRTQAARLDYLDMRGPKIAAGFDRKGQLTVLTVNGRIRESVGATHLDMAEILAAQGLITAMGFDPGGSATLVVGRETVNISPYNAAYERDVWSLPPQPRAVANGVVGY